MNELWRDVIDFEGIYQISNYGRLKSLERTEEIICHDGRTFNRKRKELIMSPSLDKDGYMVAFLRKDGKGFNVFMHRLVAISFLPNQENKLEVNHLDGNKKNNIVENLEWNTNLENITHAVKTGLRDSRGDKNANAKLTMEIVTYIRDVYKPRHKAYGAKVLANKYSVSTTTIHDIVKGRSWNE